MWKGSSENAFTITIPPGVKVLQITTEMGFVDKRVFPKLPRYIGVTGGKTYNMLWAIVEEGNEPDAEYWGVNICRYNSSSDYMRWVNSYTGDSMGGTCTTDMLIIMSYSASINGVTPNVLDY